MIIKIYVKYIKYGMARQVNLMYMHVILIIISVENPFAIFYFTIFLFLILVLVDLLDQEVEESQRSPHKWQRRQHQKKHGM